MPDEIENEVEIEEEGGDESASNGALRNRLEALERNTALQTILQDPNVRAVIEAQRSGRQVRVVVEEEEEEPRLTLDLDDEEETPEGEEPKPRSNKALAEKLSQYLDQKFSAIEKKFEQFETFAEALQAKEVKTEVTRLRQELPDFDKYKKSMLELSQKNPGLGVQELYVLAKLQSGNLSLKPGSTHTERPMHTGARRTAAKKPDRSAPRPQGKKGFDSILADALGGLDLELGAE